MYPGGRVCPGNVHWPACTGKTIHGAFQLFIAGSGFNTSLTVKKSQKHPGGVLRLWDEIEGQDAFPLDDLVPLEPHLTARQLAERGLK